jgi:hypothetical protein
MIEIEFEKPKIDQCECCGNESIRLTRFIYSDGNAHAVYYIQFTRNHEPQVVTGIISLGEWGDGTTSSERVAFAFKIWTNQDNYQVGLIDPEETEWTNIEILGQVLDREDALKHKWIKEVFHLTDHIVLEDQEVIKYLN